MHLVTRIGATALACLVGCSSGLHGGQPKATDAASPTIDSGIVSSILCSDGTVRTLLEFDEPFSIEPHSGTTGITAAPDGNLYFTQYARQAIGRITPAGLVTEFLLPVPPHDGSTQPFFWPYNIAAAPKGDGVWFTELGLHGIGHLTTAGLSSETAIPGTANYGIAAAPDGTVWFAEKEGSLGAIRPNGDVVELPTPNAEVHTPIYGVAIGPDGYVWYTARYRNKIGRVSPNTGDSQEFDLPTADSQPSDIATGPDGNLWFTEVAANNIGRITITGNLSEFAVPTAKSNLGGIAAGPDGNVWFSEDNNPAALGWITSSGNITECPLPRGDSDPRAMAIGPDGNLWFAENFGIGRLSF
jgi:streptogramin lyase